MKAAPHRSPFARNAVHAHEGRRIQEMEFRKAAAPLLVWSSSPLDDAEARQSLKPNSRQLLHFEINKRESLTARRARTPEKTPVWQPFRQVNAIGMRIAQRREPRLNRERKERNGDVHQVSSEEDPAGPSDPASRGTRPRGAARRGAPRVFATCCRLRRFLDCRAGPLGSSVLGLLHAPFARPRLAP